MNVLFPFLNFSKTYVNLIFVVDSDFIGVTSVCSRIDTNVKCYVLVLHFAFLQGLLRFERFILNTVSLNSIVKTVLY